MEYAEMIERFDSDDEPLMLMNGFDDCIAGITIRFTDPPVVCYDYDKVIEKLIAKGASEEDAFEFFEFNQLGAWVGPQTPSFLLKCDARGVEDKSPDSVGQLHSDWS